MSCARIRACSSSTSASSACAAAAPTSNFFTHARLSIGQQTEIVATAVLVRDYAEFAWWTPGLQEAWAEAEGLHQAVTEPRRLQVREKGDEREAGEMDEGTSRRDRARGGREIDRSDNVAFIR